MNSMSPARLGMTTAPDPRRWKALTDSAGSIIPALYAEGAPDTVIAQLGAVFTDAVRLSMVGAGVFLLAGLVGALAVRRAELTMAP